MPDRLAASIFATAESGPSGEHGKASWALTRASIEAAFSIDGDSLANIASLNAQKCPRAAAQAAEAYSPSAAGPRA